MGKGKDKTGKGKKVDKELGKLKDQLARALADYDNLRKRVENEKENFKKVANLGLVERLLPAIDMLRNAKRHLKDSGLELTIKELEEALGDYGIEKIDASPGTMFDEEVHEAVEVADEEGKKDGQIIEELLGGWRFTEGPVIRASRVKVKRKNK